MQLKNDDDISAFILAFCSNTKCLGVAERVWVSFVNKDWVNELVTKSILSNQKTPDSVKILINKSIWRTLSNDDKVKALNTELCYAVPCIKFSRKIKIGGERWRYFAKKCGILQFISEGQPAETFVLLSGW